ncbi:hypothetical protein Pcinc_000048 [Petrolisthes cinctipes]|uniref:CCHC-type domain-containing protein n=1 Tax=Petrolisthes cinctipes TaxID=88211 RepID=A0AAE1L4F2_PETCI|nr:hypothetical protein Pcinc_017898 [Petrolisthes cinctipes]KAK3896304.1 hypothetical protein Pcinc_000048 [Petrolisthes cinctipes]
MPKCYLCGQQGHKKPQCPQLSTRVVPSKVNFIFESELKPQGAIVDPIGEVNGQCAEVSLDTGCGTVLVNPKFVSGSTTEPKCTVYDFLGRPNNFPTAEINIRSKFFSGTVMAVVAPIKFTDVLLGMVQGVTVPSFTVGDKPLSKSEGPVKAVLQTRAATRKSRDTTPIATMSILDLPIDKASFLSAQQECDSLKPVWNSYEKDLSTFHGGRVVKYEVIDNLLYRVCKTCKDPTEVGDKQLVVPKSYRSQMLKHVRGPLTILHELLTNEKLEKELRTSYQHVLELRQRLEEGAEVALANAKLQAVNSGAGVQAIGMSFVELDDTKEGYLNLVGGREITECNIDVELSPVQKSDLGEIIDFYPVVLSDVPGKTNSVVHEIKLSSSIPVFKKPYQIVTRSVWVAVLVSVVVWGVTLWMFQRLWSRVTGGPKVQLSKILMYSWGAILEVPPPEPSVTVSGQILIGWWLLYCLVIFTGYQSSLISHLTIDTAKTKPPETMDDLMKRDGWSWGIESWILTGIPLEYFSRHTDPVVQKIYRNLEVSCQLRMSKMSGIPEGL